jgi:protein gp37
MSDRSGIEWTEATWNPLVGCSILSPGCDTLHKPLTWKKSRMIFVNSMSDLFHEDVSWRVIDKIFAVMELAEKHTFQVLTKRARIMREYMANSDRARRSRWPPPNVWLGVSAERQREADERIPYLLATPAAVRFVSAEPLLGPLDIIRYMPDPTENCPQTRLDWVIVGGESGPRSRSMRPSWALDIRDQCTRAGVPFFFKQWGAAPGREKKGGRMLDGRTWDEMPARASAAPEPPAAEVRQ